MTRVKKRSMLALLLVSALLITACGGSGQPTAAPTQEQSQPASSEAETVVEAKVLKLGHIAAPGTAYDNFAVEFKEVLEEKTEGRYTVEIYPAGQLGGSRELMESLQIGNLELTIVTGSDINQFVPELAVQDLPYLFRDWQHVENFIASDASKDLFELTDRVGMTTLSLMGRGFRHVTNSKAPIYSPADLSALKVRVAESEVYLDTFRALGANAQAMAWGEVFTALQQKTIDAHENTLITIRDYKINEVQGYVSETGHFFAFAAMLMNKNLYDSLTPEDQAIFGNVAVEVAERHTSIQRNDEATTKAELESLGMKFNEVNDKAEFEALMQSVYDKFFQNQSSEYFDMIKGL